MQRNTVSRDAHQVMNMLLSRNFDGVKSYIEEMRVTDKDFLWQVLMQPCTLQASRDLNVKEFLYSPVNFINAANRLDIDKRYNNLAELISNELDGEKTQQFVDSFSQLKKYVDDIESALKGDVKLTQLPLALPAEISELELHADSLRNGLAKLPSKEDWFYSRMHLNRLEFSQMDCSDFSSSYYTRYPAAKNAGSGLRVEIGVRGDDKLRLLHLFYPASVYKTIEQVARQISADIALDYMSHDKELSSLHLVNIDTLKDTITFHMGWSFAPNEVEVKNANCWDVVAGCLNIDAYKKLKFETEKEHNVDSTPDPRMFCAIPPLNGVRQFPMLTMDMIFGEAMKKKGTL